MHGDERQEFDRQVSLLCAAFGVPVGDRAEAYWLAFKRLTLVEFSRMIEAAMGPDRDFKRIPTVPQLWAVRGDMRAPQRRHLQHDPRARLVGGVLALELSDWQVGTQWSWIVRWFPGVNVEKKQVENHGVEYLGVIVPEDPSDPLRYPSHRVLLSDLADQAEAA